MAFDRKKPEDLQRLKVEVFSDPDRVGYAEKIDNPRAILRRLNIPSRNPTGATLKKPIETITARDVGGVVDPAEYAALSEFDREFIKSMLYQNCDVTFKAYKSKFIRIFPAGSVSVAAMRALRIAPASRAEELFGYGTTITSRDWIDSRDS